MREQTDGPTQQPDHQEQRQNPLVNLTLRNLHDLDGGKLDLTASHAIRQAVEDVQDRPNDSTARKVHVVFELKPQLDAESGALDTIGVRGVVKTDIPKRQSKVYPMLPTRDHRVVFRPDSPNDPRQMTIFDGPDQQ
ncbi:MAG: hypothetical protein ACOCTI_08765 [Phycisphaeraceae bacterium]